MEYFNFSDCVIENAKRLLIEHIKYVSLRIRDLNSHGLVTESEDGSFYIKIDSNFYDIYKNDFTANKLTIEKDGNVIINANKINANIDSYDLNDLIKISNILDYML